MPSIFLSYRRVDTSGHTGRLSDALEAKFGHDAVFHDIQSIEAGKRFDNVIDSALAKCCRRGRSAAGAGGPTAGSKPTCIAWEVSGSWTAAARAGHRRHTSGPG